MKKIDLCIGTDRNRNIRVRLSLMFFDPETGKLISEHFHSAVLSPGDSADMLRTALENHLADPEGGIPGAPWPKIPDSGWNEVLQIVKTLHTPERITQRQAADRKVAERLAAS